MNLVVGHAFYVIYIYHNTKSDSTVDNIIFKVFAQIQYSIDAKF